MSDYITGYAHRAIGAKHGAQFVAVDGEIRQLVEVKLSVVSAAHARNIDATCEHIALEYNDNSDDQQNHNVLAEPSDAGDPK